MRTLHRLICLLLILVAICVHAQVVEIPDPNLEKAIRETLEIPDNTPITQQEMGKLERLAADNREITDLTGLEYAINLKRLSLWGNPISEISPLSHLIALVYLNLAGCQVANIEPLTNLTQLEWLNLGWNHSIEDISPLANLTQLEKLWINANSIIDYSPLESLSLTFLKRDETCELPSLPIETRLKNRTFPSIFSAWSHINYNQIKNRHDLSSAEKLSLHDLNWHLPYFGLRFFETHNSWSLVGNLEYAQSMRNELLDLNPNMIFIAQVLIRDEFLGRQGEDWQHWLRDEDDNLIVTSQRPDLFLTDFTQPTMQDMIVQQVVAVARCGLFDGVFFDWWNESHAVLANHEINWDEGYVGFEAEQQAIDSILQRIRATIRDDFLIITNTNRRKIPRRAWGINGTFMETLRDHDGGYILEGIKEIEDTLLWSEENLRSPQINCLEGWGIPTEPPDSPTNLRFMRVFTTMSLTHSDGYVLYGMEDSHQHIWYDFWNANLGYPIGPKVQQYQNIDGLFIREFTNGWAVYNRSGNTQAITLPRVSTGISSNKQDITHLLPDLDGEIYLRTGKPFDLNSDGVVNILDLILVSQSFGTIEGDINGDGITNILDLTLVARQF